MTDIFAPLGMHSIWLVALFLLLSYLIIVGGIRKFLKPAMFGNLDPMNINLVVFTGPALMGFILTPFLTGIFSYSHWLIILFLVVWILIIRFSGRPPRIDLRDRMGAEFQYALLSLTAVIIVLNVIVNMIIPGKIPLLTEGGIYTRFDATQNSRLLSWMSLGASPMPGLIFALTQNKRVRRFSILVIIFQLAAGILGASKSAIVLILFILLNAMFVAKQRNETSRYKNIRKTFIYAGIVVACLIPIYLVAIGFGDGQSAMIALGTRFLGGFDQLIYASQFNLLNRNGSLPSINVGLIQYQFMPFFKALLSAKYDYSSVGQYVIALVTGTVIEGPSTFPNSNLILETIFTSGRYLGLVAFCLELAFFYRCRFSALKNPITPISLMLVYGMVFNPFGLFLSGQEWITEMAVSFFTVVIAIMFASLWKSVRSVLSERANRITRVVQVN